MKIKVQFLLIALITFVFIEIIGVFFFTRNNTFYEHRYLNISEDNYRVIDDVFWTYKPSVEIRKTAFYSFAKISTWVEYDCTFLTTTEGFPSTGQPLEKSSFNYLFLGASFIEGEGGCPWNSESLGYKDFSFYNGGLKGTGVANQEMVYDFVSKAGLSFDNVIMFAIAEEFFRTPSSNWYYDNLACFEAVLCNYSNPEWVSDKKDIKSLYNETIDRASNRSSILTLIFDYAAFKSTTVNLIRRLTKMFAGSQSVPDRNTMNMNIEAVSRMLDKHKRTKLVMISQRDEVGFLGIRHLQLKMVEDELKNRNIPWRYCLLEPEHFMLIDGHPNEAGQKRIAECALNDEAI
jgi:hypothetical protein